MGPGFASVADDVESAGRIIPSALVESGCRIGAHSRVGGRVVLDPVNLVTDGTSTVADPGVSTLAAYGGPTFTHALFYLKEICRHQMHVAFRVFEVRAFLSIA